MSIIILLLLFFAVNILLTHLCNKIFKGKNLLFRMFIAPGIIVHELSHIIACLLSGAKIQKFNFFTKKGGYVQHQTSKVPIIGQVFISFASILGGIGAMLLLSWLFGYWQLFNQKIVLYLDFWHNTKELLSLIFYFLQYNWQTWQFWLFVYLIVSISVCLMPSSQDIKNSAKGLLTIIVIIVVLYFLNLLPIFLIQRFDKLRDILIIGIIGQSFGLFFVSSLYLIKKFLKLLR